MFTCYKSLLEVRMNCRIVSSSMFQCYPWRCRSVWRKLSIRPCFFFESPFLVFVSGAVSLTQVDIAFNFLHLTIVDIYYIGASFSIITFVFELFIFRPRFSLSSANSCSSCCSPCGILSPVHRRAISWANKHADSSRHVSAHMGRRKCDMLMFIIVKIYCEHNSLGQFTVKSLFYAMLEAW